MKGTRKDANHELIAEALKKSGASVMDTSNVGDGFPDMLVLVNGAIHLVEVKNPSTSYGKKGLNKHQQRMADDGWTIHVMCSVDDALAFISALRGAVS